MVGAFIAWELAKDDSFEVSVLDQDQDKLDRLASRAGSKLKSCLRIDFLNKALLSRALGNHDLAIGAAPGFLGLQVMDAVIDAGIPHYCDISFLPEDFRTLNDKAKENGVTVIADMGVAPGLSNVLTAYACGLLEQPDSAVYYVTGLPQTPLPPFHYQLVFSPDDVIEEYIRPARIKQNGKTVIVPALSGLHPVHFTGVAEELPELEAFHTDGLRTMLDTIPAPNIAEYTLRFPGTAEKMELLREVGLFSKEPVTVGHQQVIPRELFAALAYPRMKWQEGEAEFTFLRVEVTGEAEGKCMQHLFTLYDRGDPHNGFHSMARATGLPCLVTGLMLVEKEISKPGVHPPEVLGFEPAWTQILLREIGRRGLHITHEVIESHD